MKPLSTQSWSPKGGLFSYRIQPLGLPSRRVGHQSAQSWSPIGEKARRVGHQSAQSWSPIHAELVTPIYRYRKYQNISEHSFQNRIRIFRKREFLDFEKKTSRREGCAPSQPIASHEERTQKAPEGRRNAFYENGEECCVNPTKSHPAGLLLNWRTHEGRGFLSQDVYHPPIELNGARGRDFFSFKKRTNHEKMLGLNRAVCYKEDEHQRKLRPCAPRNPSASPCLTKWRRW
jgi:hypothetical protein